jgi:pentatricopeptide repeat protein
MIILSNPTSAAFSMALEIKKSLLQGFNSFKHLKHVHARLLRLGLDQDYYLVNMFLRQGLHFGDTHYSRLVFEQAREPNIFLWNTMIRGLVSNECFYDATEYYCLMRREGFSPNCFTFPFVLKACARLLDFQLGVKIHTLVVKEGFDEDVYVKTSLLCLYASCGYLGHARKVFDDIPDKNVVSWTAIISGYIGVGQYREAIDMFRMFLEMSLRPDSFTIVKVLSACTQLGDLRSGEWIDGYMAEIGMGRNIFVATSLVDMYAKCGNMEKARSVFDGMVEKDIVTWSTMIQNYALNGLPKEALDLFFQMQRENLEPDRYAMVGVLSACGRLGALGLGDWASQMMDRNEFLANAILGTALIDMYAKCGSMVQGWEVFKGMKEKDRVVWNAIISGLAMNGHVKAAFGLFGQIEKIGIQPDGNTFIGLLCGCTHAGLVDDGRRYFDSMNRVFSLTPTIEHYGCMVDLLGRAGLLDEAHQLIKGMPMEANAIVWGALLSGCRLHRDTVLAEHVLMKLIELEPWNSGNYVLLSNIYSASHRWDKAAKLRSRMNDNGIQKIPGCSWIEVDGVVHEFRVGDKSHPLTKQIYAKLEELAMKLKAAGYVPSTDFVLFDIEEEEKEHFLGCHSEKLAIAFGLISTSPKDVIRVVKNLRVCGDCHDAIKLISRFTGREVIVRDNNRFHSFIDGSCSCRDYW